MDVEIALEFVEDRLVRQSERMLTDEEKAIFRGSWEGLSYDNIAAKYTIFMNATELRRVGGQFWNNLAELFGLPKEEVTKSKFRKIVEQQWLKKNGSPPSTPQRKFLESLSQQVFPRDLTTQLCCRLRFDLNNWGLSDKEVAQLMTHNRMLKTSFPVAQMGETLNRVVNQIQEQFEAELEKAKVTAINSWKDLWDWVWEQQYQDWLWGQLLSHSMEAREELELFPLSEGGRLPKAACKHQRFQAVIKDQPYGIALTMPQSGHLLLLARDEQGGCCCLYPSPEYGLEGRIEAGQRFRLPELGSRTARNKEGLSYGDLGQEWLLVIVSEEPLSLSWLEAQQRELQLLNEEQVWELSKEVQQKDCLLFEKSLVVVEEA